MSNFILTFLHETHDESILPYLSALDASLWLHLLTKLDLQGSMKTTEPEPMTTPSHPHFSSRAPLGIFHTLAI
jgi:hypothetical protein